MQRSAIGHLIYAVGIGGVVVLRYLLPPSSAALPSESLRVFTLVLALVAVADYGMSLWLEKMLRAKGPSGQAAVPVLLGAFGVSLAIYGLVAWLVGASAMWFWGFVGLALLHWFHSTLRWSSLQS